MTTNVLVQNERVYNGLIYQGATWQFSAQYCDDAEEPQSLAGYTVKMVIRKSIDSEALFTLTSSPSVGIILTEATGLISIELTATQTKSIQADKVIFDIIVTNTATGYAEYLFGGELVVVRTSSGR